MDFSFITAGTLYTTIAVGVFVGMGLLLTAMILFVKKKLVPSDTCHIKINSEEKLTKSVQSGQTLLSALSKEGIAIPSPCGGKATCKQCRVQILEGAGPALETDKATFSKKQLQCGWRLSCQFKIKQDVHLHIEERFLEVKEWVATVVSNENVATFIKELIVELPAGEILPYQPGGYVQFHVPPFKTNSSEWKKTMSTQYFNDWEKFQLFDKEIDNHTLEADIIRAYSLASYPAEGSTLKFNIRIATPPFMQGKMVENIPWGICSSYTFSLKKGDKIRLSGPYGESFMIHDARPLIFLIGGAGSSFGRSHVMHLLRSENCQRKIDYWYGARSLKENIYEEDLRALDKEFSQFHYHLVLSEPLAADIEKGWPKEDPLQTNYLFKAFELGQLQHMHEPEEALYYVCGPPLHNSSVLKLLDTYGVPRENIVLDDFGS